MEPVTEDPIVDLIQEALKSDLAVGTNISIPIPITITFHQSEVHLNL